MLVLDDTGIGQIGHADQFGNKVVINLEQIVAMISSERVFTIILEEIIPVVSSQPCHQLGRRFHVCREGGRYGIENHFGAFMIIWE